MVKRLLEEGADPNIQVDCEYVSAMHFAAQYADVEMMKILKPYTQDGYHNSDSDQKVTPLFSACAGNNVETTRFLIEECYLNPNQVEKYCSTPVMRALRNNANDVLAYLVREAPGFDPNIGSDDCFPCKPITIANTKQKRLLMEHPDLDLELPYDSFIKKK